MQKENLFFFSFSNESTFDRRSKAPFHDTQSLCRAAIFDYLPIRKFNFRNVYEKNLQGIDLFSIFAPKITNTPLI